MLRAVEEAAEEAGLILLRTAGEGFRIFEKQGHELVTTADRLSEEFLRERLGEIDPSAAFYGEETSGDSMPPPPLWIVDPLDGTNNYAHGYPAYSVSIAYCGTEGITLGCIRDPLRRETFSASLGGGSRLNGESIRCTSLSSLDSALLATGFPYHRKRDDLGLDLGVLKHFLGRVQGIRRGGSAALDLAYVACGRLDGFWEEHLKPWDMAAGTLLVTEAGGRAAAWEGGEWTRFAQGVTASGPGIHEEMVLGVRGAETP